MGILDNSKISQVGTYFFKTMSRKTGRVCAFTIAPKLSAGLWSLTGSLPAVAESAEGKPMTSHPAISEGMTLVSGRSYQRLVVSCHIG